MAAIGGQLPARAPALAPGIATGDGGAGTRDPREEETPAHQGGATGTDGMVISSENNISEM